MVGNDMNGEALRNLRRTAEAAAVSQSWFAGSPQPREAFGGAGALPPIGRDPRLGRTAPLVPRQQEPAGALDGGRDWFGPRHRTDLPGSVPNGARRTPPEHLQPIVAQLFTGATDLTASRQLGLSPRTYSRRVSELLEYLGVESRFQAGVEAARRGWLPPQRQDGVTGGLSGGHGGHSGLGGGSLRAVPVSRMHCEAFPAPADPALRSG